MVKDLFFNRLVTKDMQPVHGGERFFEGYLTVQIKDKQGEITVVDELYKVLPVWMDRGAPISDTHSNRIIGKGINYSKATYKDKDGEEYPAIKITGKIHKDYELDNEIWKKIKSGEYKGLSFGGATKSDRDPVRMKDGSIAYSLKDLEHYEVAVCADPAVPLALITDYNPVAKSATNAEVREDGKMIIKCDKFGCYITKPIPDGKGGKGDFDHCEEKNQDKNDPAAFCGAIQHKLEKAIEAGMLQQVTKDGLEIFLTKEELNKVCSGCGKTLGEHGIVKYDHSNSMGDQHSMYNQNTGRETWVGQGLPQPTVEGKDDHPAEQGLTINGDARQNSGKKKKGRTARNRKRRKQEIVDAEIGSMVNQSFISIVKAKDSDDSEDVTPIKGADDNQRASDYKCGVGGCGADAVTFAMQGKQDAEGKKTYRKDPKTGKIITTPLCRNCAEKLQRGALERGVTVHHDYEEEDKDVGKSFESIFKDEAERRERQGEKERKRNMYRYGDFSGDPDKMTPTPEQIANKKIRDAKEADILARKKLKRGKKKKSFELFKDSVDGKQSPTREPASGNSTRQGRGISPQRFQGQSADARALDVPRTTSGFNQRKREQRQLGDVTIPSIERKLQDEKTGRHTSRSRAPRPQGGQSTNRERKPRKSKEPKKWRGREGEKLTLGNQKRTDQPIPPKVNPTPTEHMKRPSKYTKEEWDKLPDFFKERDFKAQSDELKELQRKVDILSQPNKYPYKEKRPAETKEDWKKIDDAAQSERAKEIEDRAASGIQYGKSFGFISKKKPQKMRATVGWKQFIEDSLKDPKVPKEWKAGLRRNRKLFEHLEGNEPPSSDKVTMEDSTPKEPNQLGIIDPSKPMTKKDPNIFWGSKDDLDDTEDDDSTEPAIGNIQQNKRIFSGLKEKSLVNKRDDWDKEEKDNTDEYFGRKKEKPWTSRDQSEYEAYEKLEKLDEAEADKLQAGLQEAIDGIKLEGKIRRGMIGAFGKSFVSIFDKSRVDDLFNEKRSNRKDLRHQQAGQTGVTEIGGTPEKGADKHRVSLSGGESGGMWAKEVGSDFGDVIAAGDELKDEATRALKLDEKPAQRKYMRRKLREDAETAQPKVTEGVKRLGEKPEKKKPFDWAARNRGEGEDITWYDGNWNKRDLRTEGMEGLERKKSFVSIVKGDAEANPEMSPNEWLQWYKKRPKKKAEESNFGAGQRGLGYGNEGYTNVQGSGQSHTITEIPPEMEIIVHDVKDIKESKKEGYTTEAGNNKRGDPSRATDDDDSLLSPTFAKKEYGQWLSPKKPTGEEDDDNFEEFGLSDDDTNETPKKNSLASNFDEPW